MKDMLIRDSDSDRHDPAWRARHEWTSAIDGQIADLAEHAVQQGTGLYILALSTSAGASGGTVRDVCAAEMADAAAALVGWGSLPAAEIPMWLTIVAASPDQDMLSALVRMGRPPEPDASGAHLGSATLAIWRRAAPGVSGPLAWAAGFHAADVVARTRAGLPDAQTLRVLASLRGYRFPTHGACR